MAEDRAHDHDDDHPAYQRHPMPLTKYKQTLLTPAHPPRLQRHAERRISSGPANLGANLAVIAAGTNEQLGLEHVIHKHLDATSTWRHGHDYSSSRHTATYISGGIETDASIDISSCRHNSLLRCLLRSLYSS